ncbi:MAG: tripartite tricarboxylate transporter permease [Peptococcaceae bacterium]
MESILNGVQLLFDPSLILFMFVGVGIGIIVGALPGLTDPMALGLGIPFTFGMEPLHAILFLLGIHFGALYGGTITAITINTPGIPAAAATAMDGYPLTQKGKSRKALQMSALSAFIGANISVLSLVIFAPLLGKVALGFGPSEYFALGLFGLSVVAAVAGKSLPKAVAAAALGILISTIGTDPLYGAERFTFGSFNLYTGIDLIPALIGLFAVSEILAQLAGKAREEKKMEHRVEGQGLTPAEVKNSFKTILKGGAIGTFLGALPGTGAVIASFFSYNEAVRSSKTPENFGKGELDGVAAAILLGAFILHGIRVGPDLFVTSGNFVYAMFIGIIILEIMVFLAGWYGSVWIAKIVRIPRHFLFPVITVLVVTGSFALNNNLFNVWVTLIFGLPGFLMLRFEYPLPPLLLGIILGPIIEKNFCLAMSATNGQPLQFLTRPITAFILTVALVSMYFSVKIHRQIQKGLNAKETIS